MVFGRVKRVILSMRKIMPFPTSGTKNLARSFCSSSVKQDKLSRSISAHFRNLSSNASNLKFIQITRDTSNLCLNDVILQYDVFNITYGHFLHMVTFYIWSLST